MHSDTVGSLNLKLLFLNIEEINTIKNIKCELRLNTSRGSYYMGTQIHEIKNTENQCIDLESNTKPTCYNAIVNCLTIIELTNLTIHSAVPSNN